MCKVESLEMRKYYDIVLTIMMQCSYNNYTKEKKRWKGMHNAIIHAVPRVRQ